ncbi:methylated-DNA--[protein]-cysteine S-methyltransferase [Bailinhaonella thermotolerans]|uniref:Methylated-DNA--[protein]-cysteine S-methyltransferase n=1 Tax=Bailinhaonella thermotolerans TaxID=1070861 RepID=A0A3A4AYU9_9ACTN|nr:methylated-DNA--[protein]-cysteine S-methyltransferase [Bailinhaonella thermotolerans]RJL33559.1 methylated-DNA--[protein]-cysteine S-methyltransferase [Bailinhaonella thermotolerans]
MIDAIVLETPPGPLSLLEHDGAIVAAGFTPDPAAMHARLHRTLRPHPLRRVADLGDLGKRVGSYFDGDLDALDDLPVNQPGNERMTRLWAALREVRAGTTVNYAELAGMAGYPPSHARAAGGACARNLIAPIVPCHRVLPQAGGYGGYYYGPPVKRWLLAHEGATLP